MNQAAARGAFDPSRGDPCDPNWWRRLVFTCEAIEDERAAKYLELCHQRDVAAMAVPGLTDESYQKLGDAVATRLASLKRLLLPWLPPEKAEQGLEAWAEEARKQWIAEWGDPSSPETRARIEATVAALNRDNKAIGRAGR